MVSCVTNGLGPVFLELIFSFEMVFTLAGVFPFALIFVPIGHDIVTEILCIGLVGGAIVTPILGILTGRLGALRYSTPVLLKPLVYFIYVAKWANSFVRNQKICLTKYKLEVQTS